MLNNGAHILRPFLQRRKMLIAIFQALLVVATYYSAFILRLDSLDLKARNAFLWSLPWVLGIKLAVFHSYGLLRGWWRYAGMSDLVDITKASLTSGVLICVALWIGLWPRVGYPQSVVLIDLVLTILFLGGARF